MQSEKEAGQVLTSENAADFYFSKMGIAPKSEPVAEVEETPSEPVEENSESVSEEEKEAKPTEERKPNPKLEKRFTDITRQREEARKEAQTEREARAKLEEEVKTLRQQSAPKATNVDAKPQPNQFEDAFEYAEALAEWSTEQALVRRDQEDVNRRADAERQKVIQTWASKVATAKSELPDFDDMVASSDVVVPDHVRDAILESEVGPRILYELADNAELAKKITGMSLSASLREIGKLEARFESKTETKPSNPVGRSKAPTPINPIRGTGSSMSVEVDSNGAFHGTYQAWKAARKAGKIR
ncbi:hypothetical protein UFOVP21_15 [uncultured Caudovirales phage]|uniref:Scaffold protein n=1 Tax=uncultured Caudovirales phage TaxID=2100421 RepID=A0A6J5KKN9_9CAUD|nr:hypothetical protein UFOVP21_15 [uncultured Caudovirales phage]